MSNPVQISGWGGYPRQVAHLLLPTSRSDLRSAIQTQPSLIARGMGRSYGDSANASVVLQTSYFDHLFAFDANTGLLTAEAGITLREILRFIVPKGWFLPVTPGTSYVTLGGAIAGDVHGKNHQMAGTFGQHVSSMTLCLGTGDVVTASRTDLSDLFFATCGGMGLTGVILSATIQLMPIESAFIMQKSVKAGCLEGAFDKFDTYGMSTYSVAWIDCLANGPRLGRSVLMLGEHSDTGGLGLKMTKPKPVPFYAPASLLNKITIHAFNSAYWIRAKDNKSETVQLMPYFYPLDAVGEWNKLYGKAGFVQYQFVLPKADGVANMHKVLKAIVRSGQGSFLAVLKQFGAANENYLSFPLEGYTLALDFKLSRSTISVIHQLDDMIVGMGGRVYLSKDAVMREVSFKATYPKWEAFEAVREKYGAIGKFASEQSRRLGLA